MVGVLVVGLLVVVGALVVLAAIVVDDVVESGELWSASLPHAPNRNVHAISDATTRPTIRP